MKTKGYMIPVEICYDPSDNPYNLKTGKYYEIKLKPPKDQFQTFIGKFTRIEKVGLMKRYKFVIGATISLKVDPSEFEVVRIIAM
jgi:hypothetical protein